MTIMDAFIPREKNTARVYEDDDMIRFLQQKIQYYGLREFCRIHGLDAGNVSNVANGVRRMQDSIARALGYEQVRRWKHI